MGDIKNTVKDTKNGVYLSIFVSPGAKNGMFPASFNTWRNTMEITVCSPAKDNRANKEVRKTLARYFKIPIQDVVIVSGEKNKNKTVLLKDIDVPTVLKQLRESLHEL